ncbi:MAG: Nramp family divalent metal transporter [Candidatus Eremiobacteraeota bacterium]|nr:Nramp family divalent metal transporter [Candidatus Eremiobacteraeota bacterium]MBV9056714.1 Nramp family divalent metal transporter [Candidatus Eremiobacteraeota bacterium]MBV9700279.1 Nramp family divalent metal transporter [Candidatus Eremiobacteraeota bacterium]
MNSASVARTARPNVWRSVIMFLSIVGPGIITANADNDVGGILTYSQAGAQFGYSLLWVLIPITVALIVVQEMCARMGAVTGKGLADLIRESFGVKVTFWCLLLFVLGDVGNTATEFAGVASSAPIFGGYLNVGNAEALKIALVAGAALFVFLTVTRGSAKVVERIFFFFCFVYIAYVVSAFAVRPDWHDVVRQSVVPHFQASKAYILMIIAIIGTTISPWMQFYIQAAVVDKGVRADDYAYSRFDVVAGGVWTDVIAYFIIVSCAATVYVHNLHAAHPIVVKDVGDVAVALQPLAGKFAALLFALGLLNAAVFTASILPLSTAYYVCEAFGFERGIHHTFFEAPIFYGFYLTLVVIGAGVVVIPGAPLLAIIFYSQVLNGMLLPIVLVLMLLLINNKRLMGGWTNGPAFNVIAWATVAIVGALTLVSTAQIIFPALGS